MYVHDDLIAVAIDAFRDAVEIAIAHADHGCADAVLAVGRAGAFAQILDAVGITDAAVWGDVLPGQVWDSATSMGADPAAALNVLAGRDSDADIPAVALTVAADITVEPQAPPFTEADADAFAALLSTLPTATDGTV